MIWTERENDLLLDLYAKGALLRTIALEINRPLSTVMHRIKFMKAEEKWRNRILLAFTSRKQIIGDERIKIPWTEKEDAIVSEMFHAGSTDSQIAKAVNRTRSAIMRRRSQLGLRRVTAIETKPADLPSYNDCLLQAISGKWRG